eukprot:g68956.t1
MVEANSAKRGCTFHYQGHTVVLHIGPSATRLQVLDALVKALQLPHEHTDQLMLTDADGCARTVDRSLGPSGVYTMSFAPIRANARNREAAPAESKTTQAQAQAVTGLKQEASVRADGEAGLAQQASKGQHPALRFFNQMSLLEQEKEQHHRQGQQQLYALRTLAQSTDADTKEDQECKAFLSWASRSEHVKSVEQALPIDASWGPAWKGWTGTLMDFAPMVGGKGGPGDDWVYQTQHDVWENVPRGCAMLQLGSPNGTTRHMWAVRANRKFTGHEDEGKVDAALYTVPGPPCSHILVTLKENGQVCHVAARRVTVGDCAVTLLILGSKKVHVVVPFSRNREEMLAAMQRYDNPARYDLVRTMAETAVRFITEQLVDFLAAHRLVINSELILPSSTGPIDNATLHGVQTPLPMAFSLTVNMLHPPPGLELCANPIYSLQFFQEWGWHSVAAFLILSSEGKQVKQDIAKLPALEGAVLYHMNANGVAQLEKAKAGGYVVIRALREKARRFVYGGSKEEGLLSLLGLEFKDAKASKRASRDGDDFKIVKTGSNKKPLWFVCGREVEAIAELLASEGGRPEQKVWKFEQEPDEAKLMAAYRARRRDSDVLLRKTQDAVTRRIGQIDHVPLSAEERQDWTEIGRSFMQWIRDGLASRRFSQAELFDHYSTHFTEFLAEFRAAHGTRRSSPLDFEQL